MIQSKSPNVSFHLPKKLLFPNFDCHPMWQATLYYVLYDKLHLNLYIVHFLEFTLSCEEEMISYSLNPLPLSSCSYSMLLF